MSNQKRKLRFARLSNPLPRPRRQPCSLHRRHRRRNLHLRFQRPTLVPTRAQTILHFSLTSPSTLSRQRMPTLCRRRRLCQHHSLLRSLSRRIMAKLTIPCSPPNTLNQFNQRPLSPRLSARPIRIRRRTHTLAPPLMMGLTRSMLRDRRTILQRWSSSSHSNRSRNIFSSSNHSSKKCRKSFKYSRNMSISSQRSTSSPWRWQRQLRPSMRPHQASRRRRLRCPFPMLLPPPSPP